MTFYTISHYGKIAKGTADKWEDVTPYIHYGDRLYNPFTKKSVMGWNNYKNDMRKSYEEESDKK